MPGRVFISYRREETAYPAGWLFDRLADRFGETQIFKDIDSIEPGDDFVETITRAVESCDVLLALIGDQWLTTTDAKGHRRLDDPNDYVRLEIGTALSRHVRVIPILVEGANMPRADELPRGLAPLANRQALELSPSRFADDIDRLLRVLDKTLASVPSAPISDRLASGSRSALRSGKEGPPPSESPPKRVRRPRTTLATVAVAVAAAVGGVVVLVPVVDAVGPGASLLLTVLGVTLWALWQRYRHRNLSSSLRRVLRVSSERRSRSSAC